MYCVSQHATGDELFFLDDYDRLGFESTLVRTLGRYEIELLDYCLSCESPEAWPWGGYGGVGRISPAHDAVLERLVAHELLAWRRQLQAVGALAPSAGHGSSGRVPEL